MNLKTFVKGFGAVSAALLVMVGCSNPAAESSKETPDPRPMNPALGSGGPARLTIAEPSQPKVAIPSEPAKKKYVIGVSLLKQDDDFYQALKQGLIDQASKQNVTVDIMSADLDASKQTSQVQNFITKKVDAIVLCPVDSQAIGTSVVLANQANIPVFTADIASKSGKVVCHVASDNVEGGRLAGEYAAKLLNNKGNIGILDLRTVTSVQDRVRGFREAIAKYPDVKIVDAQEVPGAERAKAVDKATNMLTAHPEIDLIFGINDNVGLGTLSALQQVKNTKVMVIGFDAGPEAQTNIASGTSQLKADAIQFPHLIGVTTVDAIVRSLNGESLPATIPVPTGLVTVDSFTK
jgi:ribose transport system substrate-binding protein